MLDEANTCISSKLEEIIDNENLENEKNIDNDMKILNLKLDEKLERSKLNTVKDYIINKNMNIKNLFPYEQKKLRRSDDNEINKINIPYLLVTRPHLNKAALIINLRKIFFYFLTRQGRIYLI